MWQICECDPKYQVTGDRKWSIDIKCQGYRTDSCTNHKLTAY